MAFVTLVCSFRSAVSVACLSTCRLSAFDSVLRTRRQRVRLGSLKSDTYSSLGSCRAAWLSSPLAAGQWPCSLRLQKAAAPRDDLEYSTKRFWLPCTMAKCLTY